MVGLGNCCFDLVLVAHQHNDEFGVGGHGLDGAGDNGAGRFVASHCVQRHPHGSLLLVFFLLHLAALVESTIRADAVRQNWLIAAAAILYLRGPGVMMTPPGTLPGMRRASLRYCHVSIFRARYGPPSKGLMLGVLGAKSSRATDGSFEGLKQLAVVLRN